MDFLVAKARALIFCHDLVEESRCDVQPVLVTRPARDVDVRVADEGLDEACRSGSRGDAHAGSVPEAHAEHEVVPGLLSVPRSTRLIKPSVIMLRSSQSVRFVGAETQSGHTVRPRQPSEGRVVLRAPVRPARHQARWPLDHHVSQIGSRRRRERDPAGDAVLGDVPHPLRPSPRLPPPAASHCEPLAPVALGRTLGALERAGAPCTRPPGARRGNSPRTSPTPPDRPRRRAAPVRAAR